MLLLSTVFNFFQPNLEHYQYYKNVPADADNVDVDADSADGEVDSADTDSADENGRRDGAKLVVRQSRLLLLMLMMLMLIILLPMLMLIILLPMLMLIPMIKSNFADADEYAITTRKSWTLCCVLVFQMKI